MLVYEIGDRDGMDSWRIAERPVPTPGPEQVLIRVHAVSLNHRDILLVKRQYPFPVRSSETIPVSDGAGVIEALGANATEWQVGDRVAGAIIQTWISGKQPLDSFDRMLGSALDGMLAQYVVLDQNSIVRVPDHLSPREAATLPVAAVTAWNALFGMQPLLPGETVLTLGTGGVATFATQFANAVGARVIALSSSDQKLMRAKSCGAHDVVNYQSDPEWDVAVRKLTGGAGADHIIDVGGKGTTARALACVRPGGVVSILGAWPGDALDPIGVLGTSALVRGMNVGSRETFEKMNACLTQWGIRPVISATFDFRDAKQALASLASGDHVGKVVIAVSDIG